MFTGIQSYGSTYRREMGETPADVAKAQKYQQAQRNGGDNYRPREMGEKPEDVMKTGRNTYTTAPERGNSSRPREMGETPEDVAKANEKNAGPKKAFEMTEQERRIDLFA